MTLPRICPSVRKVVIGSTSSSSATSKFFRLGVDGVFSDFSNTAVAARAAYLREMGVEPLVQ